MGLLEVHIGNGDVENVSFGLCVPFQIWKDKAALIGQQHSAKTNLFSDF